MATAIVFLYVDIAFFKIREKYNRGEKWVFRIADEKELPTTYHETTLVTPFYVMTNV